MTAPPPLPAIVLDPIVRLALAEDLGRAGDLTTDATIAPGQPMAVAIVARQTGVLAGMDAAAHALGLVDLSIEMTAIEADGDALAPGDVIAELEGPARSLLTAERTMLNFIGRLSGVATLTARYVSEVAGTKAKIVCTRKTTPGHRALEKRAVRCGGGTSHRYGLDDAILIKDNHIAASGGSLTTTLERAHAYAGHLRMIEIEVDTLAQLDEILALDPALHPHACLLDNMSTADLAAAVARIDGRFAAEASGGVTLETVGDIARTGVDFISVGALTHSAPNLDVGLDAA
ncbi:MAG: carboxylating nicotinate-nucleotide diphosphorylase [Pseudomonadota bacterium]